MSDENTTLTQAEARQAELNHLADIAQHLGDVALQLEYLVDTLREIKERL